MAHQWCWPISRGILLAEYRWARILCETAWHLACQTSMGAHTVGKAYNPKRERDRKFRSYLMWIPMCTLLVSYQHRLRLFCHYHQRNVRVGLGRQIYWNSRCDHTHIHSRLHTCMHACMNAYIMHGHTEATWVDQKTMCMRTDKHDIWDYWARYDVFIRMLADVCN